MYQNQNAEELRQKLLDDIYAGACSGLGAMILDADQVQNADPEELEQLAKQYGFLRDDS